MPNRPGAKVMPAAAAIVTATVPGTVTAVATAKLTCGGRAPATGIPGANVPPLAPSRGRTGKVRKPGRDGKIMGVAMGQVGAVMRRVAVAAKAGGGADGAVKPARPTGGSPKARTGSASGR